MRIIHICLRYPPATGGVEHYVQEIVEKTRSIENKRDVRVLASKMRTHGPITELAPNLLLDDPIYLQRLHFARTPLVSYPRLQALNYYLGHHMPDIIHSHSFWYQPADVAARYAAKHNIPLIFNPYYYDHGNRRKMFWKLYQKTVGRFTFAQAAVVAVISPFEQQLIENAGLPVKRFELLPPGIDVDKFVSKQDNPYLKRGIKGQVILTVGRISKAKKVAEAIEILPDLRKTVPDACLVIVGEDFGGKNSLIQLVKHLDLGQHVHFLGRLSNNELIGAYQHAKLLLHTSHFEAFGIVLAESLACGTPVVARNASAIPYVVPDKRAGLLFQTKDELLAALHTLLTNANQRRQLGNYGQSYVMHNFSWDKTIKKLTELYLELGQLRQN